MKYLGTIVMFLGFCGMLAFVGCTKENTTTVTEPEGSVYTSFQPKGTISGKVSDRCTGEALSGVVISVGYDGVVHSATTDASGSFSFANVPAGKFKTSTEGGVWTGDYNLTASFVEYNKSQTDTMKRYKDYYYEEEVHVTFTSLIPGDSLGVHGLVGSACFQVAALNTEITGTVVDMDLKPVANARVFLFNFNYEREIPIVLDQTTSSSDGSFKFMKVENGIRAGIHVISGDGMYEQNVEVYLPCNIENYNLRTQVSYEQIKLVPVDNVNPYVISITPINGSDVSPTNLQIVCTFSEPIKQTPYTRVDLPPGSYTIIDDIDISFGGFKKGTASDVPFTAQWDASFTTLTITPRTDGIVGSAWYSVDLTDALTPYNIKDNANRGLVNNPNIIGDFEDFWFSTNGSSTVPSAPVLVRKIIPGMINNLDFYGGNVFLQWNYDANARSYNIYRKVGSKPYELYVGDIYGLQQNVSTGLLVDPQTYNNPLKALSVNFQVRAVSKDLVESATSNTITIQDVIDPRLLQVSNPTPVDTMWSYILRFSEPLVLSAAENIANYSFNVGGYTVRRVDYFGGSSPGDYYLRLLVYWEEGLPTDYRLTVGQGVTDLVGNPIDKDYNSRDF